MGQTPTNPPSETPSAIVPLLAPLAALQQLLDQLGGRSVIIGGVAVSLISTPRLTADVDAVILLDTADLPTVLVAASLLGIEPRIPDAIDFARKHRVMLLRHTATAISIDLSLGILPFEEEMIERSQIVESGGVSLRLPTPEDLIILKSIARRPKDLIDIKEITRSHPNLDRQRVEFWVRQFADALATPQIWDDIASILAAQ